MSQLNLFAAACLAVLGLGACESVETAPSSPAPAADAPASGSNTRALEAGPIWSNDNAKEVCPGVASKAGGSWTGGWWTTVAGEMSVCEVSFPSPPPATTLRDVNAGYIGDHQHALTVCPGVAESAGGTWNGHWTQVGDGSAVCGVEFAAD